MTLRKYNRLMNRIKVSDEMQDEILRDVELKRYEDVPEVVDRPSKRASGSSHRGPLAGILAVAIVVFALLFSGFLINTLQISPLGWETDAATGETKARKKSVISIFLRNQLAEESSVADNTKSLMTSIETPVTSDGFELPVAGSTGFASVDLSVSDASGNVMKQIPAGMGFTILRDDETSSTFWIRLQDGTEGSVPSLFVLVNLPDLIPSMVYNDTNSVSSIFMSSGVALPNVTGQQLYNAKFYNPRFERDEFVMPVLFPMAKKVMKVQQNVLKDGNTLVLIEAFRPHDTQTLISTTLQQLSDSNQTVHEGLFHGSWTINWFIAKSWSNHQRGCAVDVTLARVNDVKYEKCGKYDYLNVTSYQEYEMPSQMHELSYIASPFDGPVDPNSKTAWQSVNPSPRATSGSRLLQKYFTDQGMTPLASEYWHFNDLDTRAATKSNPSYGRYTLDGCYSIVPD